jgi:hypothetical protein
MAAARGEVPAAVQAVFNTLPATDRDEAAITWASLSQAERKHSLVLLLQSAKGVSRRFAKSTA